jgi:signal transduction histidine kinase
VSDGTKKPAFLGQALLLVVPVIVLLVIGLGSLRQDKAQAHREAAERAQHFAGALVVRGIATFLPAAVDPPAGGGCCFQVDASGTLLFPPMPALIPKPLLITELIREQAELWRSAQKLESQSDGSAQAVAAYTSFVALGPPEGFAANALYSLGLLHLAKGDYPKALSAFGKVVEDHPEAVTEGGMPLRPLALLKLLELRSRVPSPGPAGSLDSVCSNLIYQPTPLSRALLRQAGLVAQASGAESGFKRWSGLWNDHERARRLYFAAAREAARDAFAEAPKSIPRSPVDLVAMSLGVPSGRAFWFKDDAVARPPGETSENWLAVPIQSSPTGSWFACFSERQAEALARSLIEGAGPVERYLAAEISVARKTMVLEAEAPVAQDGEPSKELLGYAARPEAGDHWLEARVYLTHPAILYRHQRGRQIWFGALIACCAVAALAGLAATWRAFKRQQRLSELKSNFVSSVSHELRTPVASVRLLVEGLESGRVSGSAKQKEYLHLMRQECRRLSGLIENILDFSRIDDGRKQFEFSATEVEVLASETVKMVEPYAAERKVSLALTVAGVAPSQLGLPMLDGLAIRQALLNLLDNAIKHSPEGGRVTVGLEWAGTDDGGRRCVLISVEDNGAGIPAEEHEKIFERFYRRGTELNRETQGIGIGLTIVKHIVEAHGGRIRVRSATGQGSKFTMELPLHRTEETAV